MYLLEYYFIFIYLRTGFFDSLMKYLIKYLNNKKTSRKLQQLTFTNDESSMEKPIFGGHTMRYNLDITGLTFYQR